MRSAFADLWPRKLRERRSKGSFSAPWQEALPQLAHVLLNAKQLHLVERGVLNHTNLRSRLERFCRGLECNEYQLRQIILLELWLRSSEDAELAQLRPAA